MDSGIISAQISTQHDVFSLKSSNSANDWSKTRLSVRSSAVCMGAHLYWICANR